MKYRDPARQLNVVVGLTKSDKQLLFYVQDTGLRISRSHMSMLFVMFKRFHDHIEGSGIGHYIVKRIVDNAGGENRSGKRTRCRHYFQGIFQKLIFTDWMASEVFF